MAESTAAVNGGRSFGCRVQAKVSGMTEHREGPIACMFTQLGTDDGCALACPSLSFTSMAPAVVLLAGDGERGAKPCQAVYHCASARAAHPRLEAVATGGGSA